MNELIVDDKGFTCECGKRHDFPGYVYAHWNDTLFHTCECSRQHEIIGGTVITIVTPIPARPAQKEQAK